ncbi:glycoside hydrolase family 95-like protein [Dactylosporangium sp. NPDC049525]|uniref:glycoside hydrolase family 95-like protein n=1 Tax=Dactylosporangium sp. NPDC049525 TaxID=3154730 RepID=UPI00341FB500
MLEKFDVLTLESRDQGMDGGDWNTAINTYLASPGYSNIRNNGQAAHPTSRFLVDAARLGRANDLAVMFPVQYRQFFDTPNLLQKESDYYSAQGYGTWSAALQEALSQSVAPKPALDPVIRVFPAWPTAWDAKYKLLAKGGFVVSSSMASQDVQYVEIESQLGGTAKVRNPWATNVVLYRNGVQAETLSGSLLSFATTAGETIVMVRPGTTPDQYRSSSVVGTGAKVNDTDSNISYGGSSWAYSSGRNSGDYQADVHYATANNDSFQFTFTGTGVDYVTEKNSDMGQIDIYIDGVFQQTVDCANPTRLAQQVVYSKRGLATGTHTIRGVKKTGQYMLVDAFAPSNDGAGGGSTKVNDTDSRAAYVGGTWTYSSGRLEGDYQADVHYATANNDSFQFTFTGTGVDYVTEKNSDMGQIDIYIDGVFQQTVDCANPTRLAQQVVYSKRGLATGTHTIRGVKKTGQYMLVDAFTTYN